MPTVLITGASRGIGLEFARQYAADGARVLATCRDPDHAEALSTLAGDVTVYRLDVTEFAGVDALADTLDGEAIDILVNNAGMLSSGQRAGGIDFDIWEAELRVNTMGPIKVAQAFLPHLKRGTGRRIAFLSSTLASIAENTSGAYIPYRSSKAGLNAAGRSLAMDTAGDGMIVLMLHPGWVQTDMGGPRAAITPEASVQGLRRMIAEADEEHSGRFFSYDGRELPW